MAIIWSYSVTPCGVLSAASTGSSGVTPGFNRVQGGIFSTGGTGTTTVTYTSTGIVASGDTVILNLGTTGNANTDIVSVQDDKGNNYNLGVRGFDSGVGFGLATYYLQNVTNGPSVFTFTMNFPFTFQSIWMDEFSGVSPSGALDGSTLTISTLSSGTDVITSGTITTGNAGDLIYSTTVNVNGVGTVTDGTGFTGAVTSGSNFLSEYLTQPSAGTIAGTFSLSGGTGPFITSVIALPHA